LIDQRDNTDVVIDGTIETGSYVLQLSGEGESEGCCPPGSLPASLPPADYKVKGKGERWNGVRVYVSGNRESKTGKAILLFPDIFGVNGGRTKQVADEYGLQGFLAVVLDFFGADAWTADRDFAKVPEWAKNYQWDTVGPQIDTVVHHLQAHGFSKLGAVGFCWGSWPVLASCASGNFSAGVSFHPSHPRICEVQGLSQADLVGNVKCPQLMCPAGNDPPSVKENGSDHQILSKKPFGKECVFREFPDMAHGWVVRGDLSDATVARDVRIAMDLSTSFFRKHLK